jgi:hypothetical protein
MSPAPFQSSLPLPPPLFWTTGGLPPWICSSHRLHCSGQHHEDYRPGLVPVTAPNVLDNRGLAALDLLQSPPPLFWTTARGLPPWTCSSYRPQHCSGQQGAHRPGSAPATASTVLDNSTRIAALDLFQSPPPLFWTTAWGLPPWTCSSYRLHCSGQQHTDYRPGLLAPVTAPTVLDLQFSTGITALDLLQLPPIAALDLFQLPCFATALSFSCSRHTSRLVLDLLRFPLPPHPAVATLAMAPLPTVANLAPPHLPCTPCLVSTLCFRQFFLLARLRCVVRDILGEPFFVFLHLLLLSVIALVLLFRLLGSRSVLRNCPTPLVVASGHSAMLASPLFCVTHGADSVKFTSSSPARGMPPHAGRFTFLLPLQRWIGTDAFLSPVRFHCLTRNYELQCWIGNDAFPCPSFHFPFTIATLDWHRRLPIARTLSSPHPELRIAVLDWQRRLSMPVLKLSFCNCNVGLAPTPSCTRTLSSPYQGLRTAALDWQLRLSMPVLSLSFLPC